MRRCVLCVLALAALAGGCKRRGEYVVPGAGNPASPANDSFDRSDQSSTASGTPATRGVVVGPHDVQRVHGGGPDVHVDGGPPRDLLVAPPGRK